MATVVAFPGKEKILGKSFDKFDAFLCANGLGRYGAYNPRYDSVREARQDYHWQDGNMPTVYLKGIKVTDKTGAVSFKNSTGPSAENATYTGWIHYPPSQGVVTYWPNNSIAMGDIYFMCRYDIKTREILDVYEYNDHADTWFNVHIGPLAWAVGQAVLGVATAGASSTFTAEQNAAVSVSNGGSITNAALSVAAAYLNAPTTPVLDSTSTNLFADAAPAATSGATTVSDDYGSIFDSFDFSDGEALTSWSDATNVDFGFDTPDVISYLPESTLSADELADSINVDSIDLGATMEGVTGFGTGYIDFNVDTKDILSAAEKGLPVAVKAATGAGKTTTTTTATGGGTKTSQQTVATTASAKPVTEAGSAPLLNTAVGVLGQVESMIQKTFTGQLKPNTGSSATGITGSTTPYLMIGVALIAAYVIVKGVK